MRIIQMTLDFGKGYFWGFQRTSLEKRIIDWKAQIDKKTSAL